MSFAVIAITHLSHPLSATLLVAIVLLALAAPLGTAMIVGGMIETLVLMTRSRFDQARRRVIPHRPAWRRRR